MHLAGRPRVEQCGGGPRHGCQIPIVRKWTSDFDYTVECPQRQKKFPHCGANAPQRGNFVCDNFVYDNFACVNHEC